MKIRSLMPVANKALIQLMAVLNANEFRPAAHDAADFLEQFSRLRSQLAFEPPDGQPSLSQLVAGSSDDGTQNKTVMKKALQRVANLLHEVEAGWEVTTTEFLTAQIDAAIGWETDPRLTTEYRRHELRVAAQKSQEVCLELEALLRKLDGRRHCLYTVKQAALDLASSVREGAKKSIKRLKGDTAVALEEHRNHLKNTYEDSRADKLTIEDIEALTFSHMGLIIDIKNASPAQTDAAIANPFLRRMFKAFYTDLKDRVILQRRGDDILNISIALQTLDDEGLVDVLIGKDDVSAKIRNEGNIVAHPNLGEEKSKPLRLLALRKMREHAWVGYEAVLRMCQRKYGDTEQDVEATKDETVSHRFR